MTRSLLVLAAVAGALVLGACGGSDNNGDPASKQDAAFEGALKFAKCMRDHGVNVPDPQRSSGGGIRIAGPKGVNPDDPTMKAAQQACQKYMKQGGGQTIDPARRARLLQDALQFARCMRSHGVNVPDPKVSSSGGLTMQFGGRGGKKGSGPVGPNPDSPAFKKAQDACQHFLGDAQRPSTNSEQG